MKGDLEEAGKNDILTKHGDQYDAWLASQGVTSERAEMKAEITRLRAALTTIHAMSLEPSGHEPNARRQMGEIAMRALEGERL